MAGQRPLPRFPEPDTEPFWEATKQHELRYQTCDKCGEIIFYARRHCPNCGSDGTSWHTSKGEGTLYTYSVIMQSRHPAFADLGPYALAYVDLDEGFRIMTNIVGVDNPVTGITIGMRVKVRWEDQGDGEVSLPMFEPA
ncbi:MAG: Zn-ribbon domain-containing OB-fold protein [Chloroflexi bacterium]|nr:Zn-ribbon domain-containing OB-fold protein [Chloroflexota bacterium]